MSERDGYELVTERERLDDVAIHAFLTRSYWAKGVSLETVRRSLDHSLCFGVLHEGRTVAFARAITDRATYAYLADIYVLEEHRGKGLGQWLVEAALAAPELQGLRRWSLVTDDAHGLYERFGFGPLTHPERIMEYRP